MSRIVKIAKMQIGYVEKAGNDTIYGEWFGMNGTAWCGIFVSWCFYRWLPDAVIKILPFQNKTAKAMNIEIVKYP